MSFREAQHVPQRSDARCRGSGRERPTVAREEFRDLMAKFPSGVVVITASGPDGRLHGMTCTSLSSVTIDPPTLLVCLDLNSGTLTALRSVGYFAVNFLHERGVSAAKIFASPTSDRFARVSWTDSVWPDTPWLVDDALAIAVCSVSGEHVVGDHAVVFGEVVAVRQTADVPLLYGLRRFEVWPDSGSGAGRPEGVSTLTTVDVIGMFGPGRSASDDAETGFTRYVASKALLSLQDFRTDAPGEPCFLIVTQVMELMFKLSSLEARRAQDHLGEAVPLALADLRRLCETQKVVTQALAVLALLSPVDYLQFRGELGDGSGFQSYAYRQWECALGKKNPGLVRDYLDDPVVGSELRTALAEPGLYDTVLCLFPTYGIDLPPECLKRDWAKTYEPQGAVESAWRTVYAEPERYADLYRIAEALMDVAYEFARWQATHVLVVERVLGAKVGTGGTSGVTWLRRASEARVFPELWSVRASI